MTVIAYRDGIMAADSLVTYGHIKQGRDRKIYRSMAGWLGGAAGDNSPCEQFKHWVETEPGSLADHMEKVDGELSAIVVDPMGRVYTTDNSGILMPLDCDFVAIGMGSQIAIGAMAAGASAEEAARIATEYCVWCAGPVQVERIGG